MQCRKALHLISVPPAVASSDPPGSQAIASTGAPCSTVVVHCKCAKNCQRRTCMLLSGTVKNIEVHSVRWAWTGAVPRRLQCRLKLDFLGFWDRREESSCQ